MGAQKNTNLLLRLNTSRLHRLNPAANDSPLSKSPPSLRPTDQPIDPRLPLGPYFTIYLQANAKFDNFHPNRDLHSEIIYADFQDFDQLVKYVRRLFRIEGSVVLSTCYQVTVPDTGVFLRPADEIVKWRSGDPGMNTLWQYGFVQDQKSWDGVVFSAQRACKPGLVFSGIYLGVAEASVSSLEFESRVLGDDYESDGGKDDNDNEAIAEVSDKEPRDEGREEEKEIYEEL
jgi:hypothetical protein